MSLSDASDRLYLEEMLGAIEQLSKEVDDRPVAEWIEDRSRVAAASMYLIVLGEGAQKMSARLKATAPEIPWADMAGLRNRLAHGYFRADRRIIWQAAALYSPALVSVLQGLLLGLGPEET